MITRVENGATIEVASRITVKCEDEKALRAIAVQFEHSNPQFYKNERFGRWKNTEERVITTWTGDLRDGVISVPRGGMQRVREALQAHGHMYKVRDARVTGERLGPIPEHRLTLYPYQEELVQAALKREQGILRAPTGAGKTVVGFALASRLQLPTLVIVWSSSLLEQWVERAGQELGISDVGIIQGSKTKIRPLTIAMQQSLARRGVEKLSDKFGLVICDEVQRFAAGTFFKSVDPFSARYRFGISDDERRKDSKEFLIHDLFGDVAASITREEVVASKHVLDVEVRVMPTDFRADWYGFSDDSLDLPFDKGVKSEKELNFNRLLQEMTTDVARNNLIKQIAVHEVKSGEQVLVMSHRREHCSELRVQFSSEHQITSGMMLGGADYKVDFRDSKSRIKSGELRIGIGTLQAIGQGLDLPKVAVGVVATPIAGNKQLTSQVRGRVCRIAAGKSSARLYVLWDKYVYPKHVDNLCKWNARVVVWDGARWMNGAEWIERNRISKEIFSFR